MKKTSGKIAKKVSEFPDPDPDTMRPEYDFSKATRGMTAARYMEGTNIVILDPDVNALFPNSASVNEALRTLARLVKPRKAR